MNCTRARERTAPEQSGSASFPWRRVCSRIAVLRIHVARDASEPHQPMHHPLD